MSLSFPRRIRVMPGQLIWSIGSSEFAVALYCMSYAYISCLRSYADPRGAGLPPGSRKLVYSQHSENRLFGRVRTIIFIVAVVVGIIDRTMIRLIAFFIHTGVRQRGLTGTCI